MHSVTPIFASPSSMASIPSLMHRVATISSGTLDALPHNGTVLTVLQVSGTDPPRKLFRYGDDCDRQHDHRNRRCHCTGFGVRVVLTTEVVPARSTGLAHGVIVTLDSAGGG